LAVTPNKATGGSLLLMYSQGRTSRHCFTIWCVLQQSEPRPREVCYLCWFWIRKYI